MPIRNLGEASMSSVNLVIGAVALIASAMLSSATLAQGGTQDAQAWPIKPVRIIVNYPPAGSTDNATRPYAERLSKALGQQFVIENRGGASGAVGVEAGVKSAPDGYTFFATPVATLAILPHARPSSYDPFKDMMPVSQFADSTLVVAVHPSVPANSVAELVAHAKANPGKLVFASSGLGTMTQMIYENLRLSGGIDMLHVPYRGGAESLVDFLSGVAQVFSEGNVLPHVQAGKAKLLAVVDSERHPDFPSVPMLSEVYPEADLINWFALFAPVGTSQAVIQKLAGAMNTIAKQPDIHAHLLKLALRPRAGTPEQLAALLRKDYDRYGKLIRDLKIRLD
jgi:tripartite-type tricarboxylate transporter receptor subunit TctC